MTDYNSKTFRTARNKGYMVLADTNINAWKKTLVGVYLTKYPNRTSDLDMLREVTDESLPNWEHLTDRVLKNYRDLVLEQISSNTARTTFARIKSVLNDMKDEVDIPSIRFADILKAKKEPTQNVYLNESEIFRLEGLEVNDEREQYVKSVFLICCYTGCRHSDAIRLTEENIDINTNTISYVSQKTRIEASLPCHRNLRNHIGKFDPSIDMYDYEFNDIIRDLCHRARIISREKVFKGGKEVVGQKWELVASHTARRSFVTNLYLRGVDLETIAKLAGHTSSQMTSRYVCCTRTLTVRAMNFFN